MFATVVEHAAKYTATHDDQLPTFDLSYVVEQLATKPEFKDWTPERFEAAVGEYRRFCALAKNTHRPINPTADCDEIWHRHILNTRKYVADTMAYFGCYFHHNPLPPNPQASSCNACDAACGGGCSGQCGTDGISAIN